MRIAVASCALAIASFSWTKWEVESRLKAELKEDEQKAWFAGGQNAVMTLRHAQDEMAKGRPAPPPQTLEGFIPAVAFEGAKDGMIFKTDALGLGYYKDERGE